MSEATAFKKLRLKHGLTQVQMAEKLAVSQSVITDIERSRIGISKKMGKKIIQVFGIDIFSNVLCNECSEKEAGGTIYLTRDCSVLDIENLIESIAALELLIFSLHKVAFNVLNLSPDRIRDVIDLYVKNGINEKDVTAILHISGNAVNYKITFPTEL